MRLLGRAERASRARGIRLRISTPDGVVLDVSSAELYLAARYAGMDGWQSVIPGGPDGAGEFSTVPLKIEIRRDA